MKPWSIFLITLAFFCQTAFSQTVWPGDVNNNGQVTEADLLALGFAFGERGTPRLAVNGNWEPVKIIVLWEGTFPDGLNFAYADCNGDGIVNEADAQIIEDNIYLTHADVPFTPDEVLPAIPGVHPKITFPIEAEITAIEEINLELKIGLGTNNLPVDNLLGISFNIITDPLAIQPNRANFILDMDSWLTVNPAESSTLTARDNDNGKLAIAYTRIDNIPVQGDGSIGIYSFVIEENAIDLLIAANDSLTIAVDSITLVTDDFEMIPVEPAIYTIPLSVEDSMTTSIHEPILQKIQAYPNPTTGLILLKTPEEIPLIRAELVNALGQVVRKQKLDQHRFQTLNFQNIPNGLYWLRVFSEYGVSRQQIVKVE